MAICSSRRGVLGSVYCLVVVLSYARICLSARSDNEIRERFYGNLVNSSATGTGEGSIAKMFDRVLEKEFSENDQTEGTDASNFNTSVADQQAVLETVAKITHEKVKRNDTQETNGTRAFQIQDVFSLENEDSDETTTLIDKKDNVFVMSNRKSKYPVLQVDLRLISDLVVVIVSAAIGGIIFSCLGQPVIVGYLLAGSLIGPGGLKFISEMVQVETVAQFGVVFLLFALGLEFSLAKLKVVGPVAVFGGLLQIVIFMCLCGIIAVLCGANLSEGVFVGSFLSMSSTAIVVKFLVERSSTNSLHGQVTIGTLIFQDCAVGLLFALLPVLGGGSGLLHGMVSMGKLILVLSIYLTVASLLSWSFVPRFLKLMMQISSQTNELYQLAAVAFCLLSAWCSDKMGLSLELGSFVAGVMISTTDFAQHTLDQVEPIRNLFAALFLSGIGMLIHVHFLWNHVDILLASVILVIVVKTAVVCVVAFSFGGRIEERDLCEESMAGDSEMNPEQVEEEFSVWKKNTPFLYDLVISHPLEWPSLTVHWVPSSPTPYGSDPTFNVHKLVLGTHTSGGAPDFLMIADGVLPTLASESNIAAKNDDPVIPKVEITQKMRVDGEVNRARCMPQNPVIIGAKTSGSDVFVFDYAKQAAAKEQEGDCVADLRLRGHEKEGYGLSWSPFKEGYLLSGSQDHKICLWDLSSWPQDKVLDATHVYEAHESVVEDVSWHLKNENIFGSSGDDCMLMIWDLRTNQTEQRVKAHDREINYLSFNPYNEWVLATASSDSTVGLFDVRKLTVPLHVLSSHSGEVFQVEWDPNHETVLASSGDDRRLMIWDLNRIGEEQLEIELDADDGPPELLFSHGGHKAKISDFSWNKNEPWVISSVAEDNTLQVWQLAESIYRDEDDTQTAEDHP